MRPRGQGTIKLSAENNDRDCHGWIIAPSELKNIFSDAEVAKMDEERQAKQKKQLQQHELREAVMSREVHPEAVDRINKAIRIAAEQGHHQLEVVTFSCKFCSDGGRRINIADPEWPSTRRGFAKRVHEFFVKELQPIGYKLHAQIISYPAACQEKCDFSSSGERQRIGRMP